MNMQQSLCGRPAWQAAAPQARTQQEQPFTRFHLLTQEHAGTDGRLPSRASAVCRKVCLRSTGEIGSPSLRYCVRHAITRATPRWSVRYIPGTWPCSKGTTLPPQMENGCGCAAPVDPSVADMKVHKRRTTQLYTG